ncbi:FAD:protein FMN transferase, partial [Tepidanaerobacter syntrophicus]
MLDTIIKIEAFGPNASSSIDEVFARIGDIESKMTVNADSSEIIEVNKLAGKESYKVSPDTFYVVKKGLEYSRLSQGRFDITIGPLVKLWGIGTDKARIPRPDEIEKALELVDYTQVLLDEKSNS